MIRWLRRFAIGLAVTGLVVGASILFLDDDAAIAFGLFGTILSVIVASSRAGGGGGSDSDGGSWSTDSDSGGGDSGGSDGGGDGGGE